jgi:hypothetical protein
MPIQIRSSNGTDRAHAVEFGKSMTVGQATDGIPLVETLPHGQVILGYSSDGIPTFVYSGEKSAESIRYRLSTSSFPTDPAGGTVVAGRVGVVTLQVGDALDVGETAYLTIWFYDSSGNQGEPVQAQVTRFVDASVSQSMADTAEATAKTYTDTQVATRETPAGAQAKASAAELAAMQYIDDRLTESVSRRLVLAPSQFQPIAHSETYWKNQHYVGLVSAAQALRGYMTPQIPEGAMVKRIRVPVYRVRADQQLNVRARVDLIVANPTMQGTHTALLDLTYNQVSPNGSGWQVLEYSSDIDLTDVYLSIYLELTNGNSTGRANDEVRVTHIIIDYEMPIA